MVSSPIETRLPTGVKDFLPVKAAKLDYLQKTLRTIYRSWGFRPIAPAILEDLAVLELGLGRDLREKTFRFDDRQTGRLVAFPPDITPQVARIAATRMRDMPLPFRLCYNGRVLRHTEQQLGKDREIYQSGVELIGLSGPEADAEMIAMAVKCLQAVGATEFTIDIGQVEFLRGILDDLPLDPSQYRQVKTALAAKDLSGVALQATPFLKLVGNLLCGHLLMEQALVAEERLAEMDAPAAAERRAWAADDDERTFYAGKVDTARFFVSQLLSENTWLAEQITSTDRSALNAAL